MIKGTLSPDATAALVNVGTNRQGTAVVVHDSETFNELLFAGLIGPKGGLTRKGSIERERMMTRLLDAAF